MKRDIINRSDIFIIRVDIFRIDNFKTFTQKLLKYQMIFALSIFTEMNVSEHRRT
jgi:hypothetical protein